MNEPPNVEGEPLDDSLELTKQQSHYKRLIAGHWLWIAPDCLFVHSTPSDQVQALMRLANSSHQQHINKAFMPYMQAQADRHGSQWQIETGLECCATYGSRLEDDRILWIELCTHLTRPERQKISLWATTAKILEVE